jgi:hypothetical protein
MGPAKRSIRARRHPAAIPSFKQFNVMEFTCFRWPMNSARSHKLPGVTAYPAFGRMIVTDEHRRKHARAGGIKVLPIHSDTTTRRAEKIKKSVLATAECTFRFRLIYVKPALSPHDILRRNGCLE